MSTKIIIFLVLWKIGKKHKILIYFYFCIFPLQTPFMFNASSSLEGESENVYVKCLWAHSKPFREVLRKH